MAFLWLSEVVILPSYYSEVFDSCELTYGVKMLINWGGT